MFGVWVTSNRCNLDICNEFIIFDFFFAFHLCLQFGAVVVIGWEMTIYTQSETEEQVELCALIQSGMLAVTIPAINIRLVDGTALAGNSLIFYKQL